MGGTMLHEFVTLHREEIIARCRAKVDERSPDAGPPALINHGVPMFLAQLVDTLTRGKPTGDQITATAIRHGRDLRVQGLTVSDVVHDYGDVCQSITELALEQKAAIGTEDFRLLNGCLDNAIAGAVTEFGRGDGLPLAVIADTLPATAAGPLLDDLRRVIDTSVIAFDVVKSGTVAMSGSTARLLGGHLQDAQRLIERLQNELLAE